MPGEGMAYGTLGCVSEILIGYVRVSTDEQDLTAQRDGLRSLGVTLDRIYVDHGLTGANRERPGLREALACRAGDTLVVTKLDRLARSLPDARDTADELTRREVRRGRRQRGLRTTASSVERRLNATPAPILSCGNWQRPTLGRSCASGASSSPGPASVSWSSPTRAGARSQSRARTSLATSLAGTSSLVA